jgi:hypothetical protein
MPTYFTTAQVRGAALAYDRFTAFMRDTLFSRSVLFNTEEIIFDKVGRRRQIAPFISPNLPGKERAKRGMTASTYRVPYLKPKTTLRPADSLPRRAGEAYGGELSQLSRHEQMVAEILADHDNEISGREEKMCCDAIVAGQVVCVGDGVNDTITYNRDAALTGALASGSRWGESGVDIMAFLRGKREIIADKSGASAGLVILGSTAAAAMQKDAEIRELLDNRRNLQGDFSLGGGGSGAPGDVARYLGNLGGEFDVWTYTQAYIDDAGNQQSFFPKNGCAIVAPTVHEGTMCYGAIQDTKSLQAEARFAKMFEENDPSAEVLLTQSAPLPVPVEANAAAFFTVVA